MPKDETSRSTPKMALRYPWIARLEASEQAQALQGRRWVGRLRKKFRVRADPHVNDRVRKLVHELGFRYLLNDERLPGTPHLVFPARRLVIFTVHGAPGSFRGGPPSPSSRSDEERGAWETLAVQRALEERGWRCELVTSRDARTKRELRGRVKGIFAGT